MEQREDAAPAAQAVSHLAQGRVGGNDFGEPRLGLASLAPHAQPLAEVARLIQEGEIKLGGFLDRGFARYLDFGGVSAAVHGLTSMIVALG
jgi:hypothetical protein